MPIICWAAFFEHANPTARRLMADLPPIVRAKLRVWVSMGCPCH